MKADFAEKLDALIEQDGADLARDIITLVNIKSVKDTEAPGAPFGEGTKKVLDTVLSMGSARGLCTRDYGVGVVSLALEDGEPELGIWAHGDVVPEGDGWNFAPYDAVEYKGCIIGRGATDNKGQLVCILHLLSMFKKLGIKLNYNPALFVGSNEEGDKADVIAFLQKYRPPRLSLVPDGGFPVGYGGKGLIRATLTAGQPFDGIEISAGQPEAAGKATARIDARLCGLPDSGQKIEISAETPPVHPAYPRPDGNMITALCSALLSRGLAAEGDRRAIAFLRDISKDVNGALFGFPEDVSLTAAKITPKNGAAQLYMTMRYPISLTYEQATAAIAKVAAENGFTHAEFSRGVDPYINDRDSEIVKTLNRIANELTDSAAEPFIMTGATYAHRLPNAYVYGANGCLPPEDFLKGMGGAHGRDESVSLARLKRAMRIYARALLELSDIKW